MGVTLSTCSNKIGLVAIVDHIHYCNPSYQWIQNTIQAGKLHCAINGCTNLFLPPFGQTRSWRDHPLWQHAFHTVELFQYQTAATAKKIQASQGSVRSKFGIAIDMSIGLKVSTGALCKVSLSFNNDGLFGTFFRCICDNGTYLRRYDDLYNGIEFQDRESNSCVTQAMEILHRLEQCLEA